MEPQCFISSGLSIQWCRACFGLMFSPGLRLRATQSGTIAASGPPEIHAQSQSKSGKGSAREGGGSLASPS